MSAGGLLWGAVLGTVGWSEWRDGRRWGRCFSAASGGTPLPLVGLWRGDPLGSRFLGAGGSWCGLPHT